MAEEKYFSTADAKEILDISQRQLYRWAEEDKIKYIKTPTGRYQFLATDVYRISTNRKDKKNIRKLIIDTIDKKEICYLRELQVTLEDYYTHDDITEESEYLSEKGDIKTDSYNKNRWYYSSKYEIEQLSEIIKYKQELMNVYIKHPRKFIRRGIVYDDYSEMLVEDALIKADYTVIAKNSHYFNGKIYLSKDEPTSGRKTDIDFIAYSKLKDKYIGIQIKNRLEYPKLNDIHLLLDITRQLDIIPVLITRISHPRIYEIFNNFKESVIQTKRYFLQPPFPRDKFDEIIKKLNIPLGIYQWTPDFLITRLKTLQEKL